MPSTLQHSRYNCHCDVTDWYTFFKLDDLIKWTHVEHLVHTEQSFELMVLLWQGVDGIRRGSSQNTPLHLAIVFRKTDIFNLLVRLSYECINAQNAFHQTPLHLAVSLEDEYMVSELLRAGALINIADQNGCTPLHMAASKNCLGIFRTLIERGGNINSRNFYGKSVIYHSCELGNRDTTYLAIEHGGDARACDAFGVEPLAALMMRTTPENVTQEILDYHTHIFNLTFPEGRKVVCLELLTASLKCRSPLTTAIIKKIRNVSFSKYSLLSFSRFAMLFDFEQIKLVSKQVPSLLKRIIIEPDNLYAPLLEAESNHEELAERFLTFLNNLMKCSHYYNFLKRCAKFDEFIPLLISLYKENKLSKETVAKIIYYLYTRGFQCKLKDFVLIYETFKFCDLIKLMLEFDVVDTGVHPAGCMSYIIYNFRLTAKDVPFIIFYDTSKREELLNYFASSKLQSCFKDKPSLTKALDALPKVPSLLQLSRDQVRQSIVRDLNCKTCQDFHKAVRTLPIADAFKEIITYQRPLYNFKP